MKSNILIIVAHPDDEAIGMGGTISKHVSRGDNVFVLPMTDGVSSRKETNKKQIILRANEARISSECLGFKWLNNAGFDDNRMDNYPLLDVVKSIEEEKEKISPQIVYTHSGADLNIDHRIVLNAVLAAFRPQPKEICKEIRLFEVPSATDYGSDTISESFKPNLFIDISNTWKQKNKALEAYKSEMRDYPHSRSLEGIKNLAKLRANQVGLNLAEAFQVIRKIEV